MNAQFLPSKPPLPSRRRLWVICTSVALAGGILAIDCLVPRGVSISPLYVIPIVLVQRAESIAWTVAGGICCAILATAGLIVSANVGIPANIVLADYAVTQMIIFATTLLGVIANRRKAQLQMVSHLLTMCAWTKKVKVRGVWVPVEQFLIENLGIRITHGISEEQAQKFLSKSGLEVSEEESARE